MELVCPGKAVKLVRSFYPTFSGWLTVNLQPSWDFGPKPGGAISLN